MLRVVPGKELGGAAASVMTAAAKHTTVSTFFFHKSEHPLGLLCTPLGRKGRVTPIATDPSLEGHVHKIPNRFRTLTIAFTACSSSSQKVEKTL